MIVIVGNGPAAVSAVEAIRKVDKDIPIRLFFRREFSSLRSKLHGKRN